MLESVPNFSEGRRPEIVRRIAEAASGEPGVRLLDLSSDVDHNRSVLTLVGEGEALVAGLLAAYEVALAEIDLRCHEGVHPRVGSVDVVPFVPLASTPMADAVAAARTLGQAVAERFDLPVYLYEEAATQPARRRLPEIRRGGFEAFADRLADPAWAPDFGPRRLHPSAGVTVIGARFFLIAFNVLLATDEVEVARRIARAVRESTGGLPAVRAIGVYLASRGRAQVSMNLLDFRRTSIARAFERVRREAEALGMEVVGSELIGMLPEEAVFDSFGELLGLSPFGAGRVLERRL